MENKLSEGEFLEGLDELLNYGRLRISHSERSAKHLVALITQLVEIVKEHFKRKEFTKGYEIKQIKQKPTVSREDIENLIIAWMELLRPDAMYDLVKKWLIAHDIQVANGK